MVSDSFRYNAERINDRVTTIWRNGTDSASGAITLIHGSGAPRPCLDPLDGYKPNPRLLWSLRLENLLRKEAGHFVSARKLRKAYRQGAQFPYDLADSSNLMPSAARLFRWVRYENVRDFVRYDLGHRCPDVWLRGPLGQRRLTHHSCRAEATAAWVQSARVSTNWYRLLAAAILPTDCGYGSHHGSAGRIHARSEQFGGHNEV